MTRAAPASPRQHLTALLLLLAVATAWGVSFTLVKDVLAAIAPLPFLFWRFLLAGLLLNLFAAARRELSRAALLPGLALGALVFGGYWAQTHALLSISPSRSAFLTGLYVVMVPFCDRLLFRTHIGWSAWSGSLLAIAGTALLLGGWDARLSAGDLLTLFGAVCFALHCVVSARLTRRGSAVALAAVQVLFVGVASAPAAVLAPPPRWTPLAVGIVAFTAIVTTAIAFTALMWGQSRVTATEAAIALAFEPVAASLVSIASGREAMTATVAAGGVLIVVATVVAQLPANRRAMNSAID